MELKCIQCLSIVILGILLIVLNGIEILEQYQQLLQYPTFNRTKWN